MKNEKYCIDTNVLIQAWQKYYSPILCPNYWDLLDNLGRQNLIFIPKMVYDEILRVEDDLSEWLKNSYIEVKNETESVVNRLKDIYSANPNHRFLVDNVKGRSLADPWVIAHAIDQNAIVVTKEKGVTATGSKKIKIPNVCKNMGVTAIDDFELLRRLNVTFSCTR